MLIISHRVNTIGELAGVPVELGVEVDIRDYDGRLCLTHDSFAAGEDLDSFLAAYRHSQIIFNTKSDGLETEILRLAGKHKVENYFFLDTALPTLVKLSRRGVRKAAVRFSEYEPIELALRFAGLVEWVWIDCFTRLPLDPGTYAALREHFRICIVSPELQGHGRSAIGDYRKCLYDMPPDAVCTDYPGDWSTQ